MITTEQTNQLEETIESRLQASEPEVELVAIEHPDPQVLRVFIDHQGGVDLALCERVTTELRDLLSEYSLEVSSPGSDRPLTKPEHFQRFVGERAKIRTSEAVDGRSNFTGTINGADAQSVTIDVDGSSFRIPLAVIQRSHLVREFGFGGEA